MIKGLVNGLRIFVCAVFTVQLIGCGTLMYPDRKGQRGGRIDAGVAILDGLGLLLFIIPGVIAFAVDFNNGTIYLPGGILRTSFELKNIKEVKFNPRYTSMASIEKIISNETGYKVKLDQSNIRVSKLRSVHEMLLQFAQVIPSNHNDRLALL